MFFLKKSILIIGLFLTGGIVNAQLFLPNFDPPQKIESISTDGEEIAPIPYATGDKLYFVRANILGGSKARKYGQEIWETSRVEGKWQPPVSIFDEANDNGNNGVIGSSKDGKNIYVFNSVQSRRKLARGIASTKKDTSNNWSELKKVEIEGFDIGKGYYSFYVNTDEDLILISKPAKKETDNEDLFISIKKDGKWSEIINLGPNINTDGFEISPFLTEDKKELYFSSNGHGGLGSADVFVSYRLGESWTEWTKPLNLEAPINSPGFDAYFVIGNNKEVFFSSNRGGLYSNIYTTKISEKKSVRKVNQIVVENQFLYKGLAAQNVSFEVFNENNDSITIVTTDEFGNFSFTKLNADEKYLLKMTEEDLTDYPGGIIYEISANGKKQKKYITTSDGVYFDINSISTNDNVVGKFQFKNLPLDNSAVLVYNSLGEIVDTIFTDNEGNFSYKKLNANEEYTFEPLDLTENEDFNIDFDQEVEVEGTFKFKSLPLSNTALLVYDEFGDVVDTIYTDEKGGFKFKKLAVDNNYTFKPLEMEGEESDYLIDYLESLNGSGEDILSGKLKFKKLPMDNTPILVLNENGDVVDTVYTDDTGQFRFKKLKGDENYTFKPILAGDSDLLMVDFVAPETEEVKGVFNYNKLPQKNIPLVVLDENGFAVDTIYTNEKGEFEYTKLNMESYSIKPLIEGDFDMVEINIEEKEKITNQLLYDDVPLKNKALVIYKDGIALDTVFTNANGEFEFFKLKGDNYTFKPLNQDDFDMTDFLVLNQPRTQKAENKALVQKKSTKIIAEKIIEDTSITLYFDFNKTDFKNESKLLLDNYMNSLNNKNITLTIDGHTDNIGSVSINQRVAKRRIASVLNYLNTNRVTAKLLENIYGESAPAETNNTVEGRAKNRRVVITITRE